MKRHAITFVLFAGFVACDRPTAPAVREQARAEPADARDETPPPPPADARTLVAIGDLHGDYEATLAVFRLAGLIDEGRHWTGGDTIAVQVGDQLDRGDGEREIMDFLTRLQSEAEAAGGSLVVLNGNHEYMNALADFRYVTPGALHDFDDLVGSAAELKPFEAAPEELRKRMAAFAPGGPMARQLADRPMAVVIDGTAFVHGGLLPHYAGKLAELNESSREWLLGQRPEPPAALIDQDGPVWSRHFSDDPDADDCALLDESLRLLEAERMVVAHTVQRNGIRSACDAKVWMIDVGMSRHYGGRPAALRITADHVNVVESRSID